MTNRNKYRKDSVDLSSRVMKNIEMEKAALSGAVYFYKLCDYRQMILEMFTDRITIAIYEGLKATMEAKDKTDPVLIYEYLLGTHRVPQIELSEIIDTLDPHINVTDYYDSYIEDLRNLAVRRMMVNEFSNANSTLEKDYTIRPEEIGLPVSRNLRRYMDISLSGKHADFMKGHDLEYISELLQNRGNYISTGYILWDDVRKEKWELTIAPNALTYVAGGTGHCKTTLLLNLACKMLRLYPELKVLLITYEESLVDIQLRVLNIFAGMNLGKCNTKIIMLYIKLRGSRDVPSDVSQSEKEDYLNFINNPTLLREFREKEREFNQLIRDGRLNIQGTDYDVDNLEEVISLMHRNGLCDIAIVDYIQLIEDESDESQYLRREQELKLIVGKFMRLSKDEENGLPIVFGAQFNRSVKSVEDLIAENIGESNAIEKSAHTLIGVYNCQKTEDPGDDEKRKEICELQQTSTYNESAVVIKNIKRRGEPSGQRRTFRFEGNTSRILDGGEPTPDEVYGNHEKTVKELNY